MATGFYFDETFLRHEVPSGHPERPERLTAIVNHLKTTSLWTKLRHLESRPATVDEIAAIHDRAYIEAVRQQCGKGVGLLDFGETYCSAGSYDAALRAAGSVISAVDAVLDGTVETAFCAVRPPGHHAEYNQAMGFCLFNNVAIGARYAQRSKQVDKVAILDWDVHHGNGTQHAFEKDPSVLFISLHQYPFYPGTGARSEQGEAEGAGYTLNIPLPAGTGEKAYIQSFDEEVIPALTWFQPGLLIISCGFDAHKDDPLAAMTLEDGSFRLFTERIMGIAPIVSVLEGGYSLTATPRSLEQHLLVMSTNFN